MKRKMMMLLLALALTIHTINATPQQRTGIKAVIDIIFDAGKDFYFEGNNRYPNSHSRFECPLCDSSVYSYCSEKLLHDACCCLDPYDHRLPRQCRYADCSFLHANSCHEHKLITACCCSRQFY